MKKLMPIYILAFVFCFMLFIYEPIMLFATNMNDFWFDFALLIKTNLIVFLLFFAFVMMFFTVLYFITKKYNKIIVFNIISILFLIAFLCLYIHGNFYAGSLPKLDGTEIIWSSYLTQNIISIIICFSILLLVIILSKRYSMSVVIDKSKYVVVTVLIMLLSSFLTTLLTTPNLYDNRYSIIITDNGIENLSNNKNFLFLVVDAVDSQTFKKELNNSSQYKDLFEDFTYFEDTMSGYPFTRDSIPLILSGKWNRNEKEFYEYSTDAYNNSKLFERLEELDYDINLYEHELVWNDKNVSKVSNVKFTDGINLYQFTKQIIKYDIFKCFPYLLKPFSKIETLEFWSSKKNKDNNNYVWYDVDNYQNMLNSEVKIVDENVFKFIHLEGAHVPFNLDEDVNYKENATYEEKIRATIKIIKTYLDNIKESGQYDNSAIIIMADHGYNGGNVDGRQNPILFIKGFDEKHKMYTSNSKISQEDLIDAYMELLDGKKSTQLFKNIDKNRSRKYLWYLYTKEDSMIEYETKGNAWDTKSLYKTGKEYKR